VWTCRCKKTRKKGRGWANLMDHIQREHEDNLDEAKKKDGGPILQFFTKKFVNQFQWVEWMVKDLLPFSFFEKLTTRKFFRLQSISVESLMNAMSRLTVLVENKIQKLLPDIFSLTFDGWSSGGTHFLTVFALWPDPNEVNGYGRAMLPFAPLQNEERLDADSHKESINEILRFYGKEFSNVACIIGDNCSTNFSFAKKSHLYFVGCASHRLNLGVKIVLQSYSCIIDRSHAVMVALRLLKARAALRKHMTLSPVLGNVTRWSSTKTMIDGYFLFLEQIALIVPADLQLSPSENRLAKQLQVILVYLDVLTVTFQDEGLQMCDVLDYLDAAMKLFPEP
jgi:hypothetical protein